MVLLPLVACIENGLFAPPKDDTAPEVDSVPPGDDTATVPPEELCNGVDDDGDGAVDEDFPDADGNGRVDCLDGECGLVPTEAGTCDQDATCEVISPVPDAWVVRTMWEFTAPDAAPDATVSITQPLIVRLFDDDGSGTIDSADAAEVVTIVSDAAESAWLVVIDGATGIERLTVAGVSALSQLAAADLEGDGRVELLAYDTDGYLVAFDAAGATVWTSSEPATAAEDGWHVVVADLDGDGATEVIADTMILDGQTGEVEATLAIDTDVHQHRPPAVGDMDGDGLQEIAMAARVFGADGSELWYTGEGVEDGVWSAFVQLDSDDAAEMITLGANLVLSDDDGVTLNRSPTFARNWSAGPCVGDFDGDGQPEFAYGAYEGFYVRDMDVRNVWYAPIDLTNHAGQAACAGYDLDADGALEALFADEHAFRIFNGRTGAVNFEDIARYESTATYASPAVGDLDGDGDVEVVVVANDPSLGVSVLAYTHDGEGWPATTEIWPVSDYDVWNVAGDGSVPAAPAAPWLSGNGVRTAPVNPRYADGADLAVTLDAVCVFDCTYGPVQVSAHVANQGLADAASGATLSVYALDGEVRRLVASATLGSVAAGATLEGIVFDLRPEDVGADGMVVTVTAVDPDCDATNDEAVSAEGCGG